MLPITADKIAEVIILARELDRAENEFDGFVDQLTEDEQIGLVGVFWIGRGSFEPEDLAEALDTAARSNDANGGLPQRLSSPCRSSGGWDGSTRR